MTVGIGVICENGKAAVIAADRLVATESEELEATGGIQFTGGKRKLIQIHQKVVFASAGIAPEDRVIERMRVSATDCQSVAGVVEKSRLEPWMAEIEERILKKEQLANSWKEFCELVHSNPSNVRMLAYQKILDHKTGFSMILIGADDSAAYLYFIDKAGASHDCPTGFYTIGHGGRLAEIALLCRKKCFDFSLDLTEAVFRVYEAKKAAEFNGAVGQETDMGVARQGQGAWLIKPEGIKKLERLYQKKRRFSKKDREALLETIRR